MQNKPLTAAEREELQKELSQLEAAIMGLLIEKMEISEPVRERFEYLQKLWEQDLGAIG